MGKKPTQSDILQGTLDMLILQVLAPGTAHGHSIAYAIERRSEDVLQVEHGSLYPALHRLEDRGWIASFWGTSENNRKARYYRLTSSGRRQLSAEMTRWERAARAVNQVLRPRPGVL
ncbi:MAG TPA: PadR family transcriptional regulator [Bryobacteraceae bacterium]|nr:PadR family transcriptional regulator [Bryobacteraceae bacterium]